MFTPPPRLAARLGLEVVPSDPATQPRLGVPPVRMRGAPHGRPVELEYAVTALGAGWARLSVSLEHPVPRFELYSARPHYAQLAGASSGLPRCSLGAELDRELRLDAESPDLGPLLAPALRFLPTPGILVITCTGATVEVRSEQLGVSVVNGAEPLLYLLEEIARALEGRPPLASVPTEAATARARALLCERCGAPVEEVPGTVHQPIEVRCTHCPARGAPAADIAETLRSMRASVTAKRWAQEGERNIRSVHAQNQWVLAALSLLLVLAPVAVLGSLLFQATRWFAANGCPILAPILGGIAALAVGWLAVAALLAHRVVSVERHRRRRDELAALAAPDVRCPDFECARCGATVEVAKSIVSACAYCGGANLPDGERLRRAVARNRAARDAAVGRSAHLIGEQWRRFGDAASAQRGQRPELMMLRGWVGDLRAALRRAGLLS